MDVSKPHILQERMNSPSNKRVTFQVLLGFNEAFPYLNRLRCLRVEVAGAMISFDDCDGAIFL